MGPKTEPNQPGREDAPRWRFGEFVLDERTLEVLVGGTRIELPRKPIEILMYFVRNPGEVITKEELFEAVWPGRIVSDSSLSNAMGRLRAAFGDEHSQELIKAVYGYGYRFMGEVVREDARSTSLPAPEPALDFKDGDPLPLRAGWVLRRRLGVGGGGDVWLGQSVAGEARVFKFARERLALTALKREITLSRLMREALGDRPDLVRVLDWNLDQAPFFIAIDHCDQGSLSDWADAHGGIHAMPLDQRLELLAQAADALAAAHSVGVLHKDLKPSNLLLHVEGKPDKPSKLLLKLSDFGSARLLDRDRLRSLDIAQLGFTQTLADTSSGTPQYLAPELLDGSPPTIRSDVYALGVVLYQLVIGDLRHPLAPGWERPIQDPLLIEDIAAAAAGDPQHRLADAAELATRLRALPARREAREREQVAAREAERLRSSLDRARARRSLWMALAAVAVIGMGLSFWQFLGARAAAKESAAVAAFLIDDMLSAANPMKQSGTELTVKSMLDQAASRINSRLKDQPAVRARIEMGLALAYQSAGAWDSQLQQLELALKDAEAAEGPEGDLSLDVVNQLAYALDGTSDHQRIRTLHQRTLANEGRLGPNHPLILSALSGLALLDFRQGRYAESVRGYETYLARRAPAIKIGDGIGGDVEAYIEAESNLALDYAALARYPEARSLAEKAIADESRHSGPDSAISHWRRVDLADVLVSAGNFEEAEAVAQTAERGLLAALGPEHPFTVSALYWRGKARLLRGDAAGALELLQRSYDLRRHLQGEDHLRTQFSANNLGRALTQLHREREAVPLLEKALPVLEAGLSPQHPTSIEARANLAEALFRSGKPARATQLMNEARPWAAQLSPNFHRFQDVQAELSP